LKSHNFAAGLMHTKTRFLILISAFGHETRVQSTMYHCKLQTCF